MSYVLQFGGLSIRDVSTSSTRTAVSHNQFLQIHPASYKFSADRSLLVLVILFYLFLFSAYRFSFSSADSRHRLRFLPRLLRDVEESRLDSRDGEE